MCPLTREFNRKRKIEKQKVKDFTLLPSLSLPVSPLLSLKICIEHPVCFKISNNKSNKMGLFKPL